tara:strand:- start:364 stop:567 length:204 start_codon:yes stop_codon:yes gene_type:complete
VAGYNDPPPPPPSARCVFDAPAIQLYIGRLGEFSARQQLRLAAIEPDARDYREVCVCVASCHKRDER